jgi:hypothetical protein
MTAPRNLWPSGFVGSEKYTSTTFSFEEGDSFSEVLSEAGGLSRLACLMRLKFADALEFFNRGPPTRRLRVP